MQQSDKNFIPKVQLGKTDFQVGQIGLGCMGLSAFTTEKEVSEEEAFEIIGKALEQGVNFLDTAYLYGTNEVLLSKVIKKFGRDKFVIATKFPSVYLNPKDFSQTPMEYTRENVQKYCQESLDRLQIEYIDLYYYHRPSPTVPIEIQVGFFKELIEQGKIKSYGISEATEDTIRRAHKVYPLTAVQEEYSLFARHLETNNVLKTCQELGISVVAYSPLGRGTLTNTKLKLEDYDARKIVMKDTRFLKDENYHLIEKLREFAASKNATAGQIALAWLMTKQNVIPIPGTKRVKYLEENNSAAKVKLTAEEVKRLDTLFDPETIKGERYIEAMMHNQQIVTPPLE